MDLQLNDIVTAHYKTGKYIGEITNVGEQSYLVKVLAVLKHPTQGDLHHPKEAEVMLFHTRRALAYREQTNVPKKMVKIFEGEIPNYYDSLRSAVAELKEQLSKEESDWHKKSLEAMNELEADYFGNNKG